MRGEWGSAPLDWSGMNKYKDQINPPLRIALHIAIHGMAATAPR